MFFFFDDGTVYMQWGAGKEGLLLFFLFLL